MYASLYVGGRIYASIFGWVKELMSTVGEHGMAFKFELVICISLMT